MDERRKRPNAFQKLHCDVCSRLAWHYQGVCGEHSVWPKRPSLGGMPIVKSTEERRRPARPVLPPKHNPRIKNLPSTLGSTANTVLCCGCMREVSKAFTLTGKVWVTTSVVTQTKSRMVWNPATDETTFVVEEKRHPYNDYRSGFICSDCASDYGVVEKEHRDGSTSWVPKVIIDRSTTLSDTLIPEREHIDSASDSKPVDANTGLFVVENVRSKDIDALRGVRRMPVESTRCRRCGQRRDAHGVSGRCPKRD